MNNCNCPDREPDPHAKHSAWRQISMDCPIHGEPTQDQLAARIAALEAERDRYKVALRSIVGGRVYVPQDGFAEPHEDQSSRIARAALAETEGD